MKEKVILHSDLNNFYATVECKLNPHLIDKCVAVCGDAEARHGIVLAKNNLAKAYGVKTGDVVWEAKQKCPDIIFVPANFKRYIEYSKKVRQIYERYTNNIESFGVDECWIDVTDCSRTGYDLATEIKETIKKELGLSVSIGISWNKIFAKIGSDYKKPDAITQITKQNYKQIVWSLPCKDLLMVGKVTSKTLTKMGITTIGDLASTDKNTLVSKFNKWGETLWIYANGLDKSEVLRSEFQDDVKSISNSTTTSRDLTKLTEVQVIVTMLSESVGLRLRNSNIKGKVIVLNVKNNKLEVFTKQKSIDNYTNLSTTIINTAMELFKYYDFSIPVRSIGIGVSDLTFQDMSEQFSFFNSEQDVKKLESLENAIDSIREKYGHFSINRGISYCDKGLSSFDSDKEDIINSLGFLKDNKV